MVDIEEQPLPRTFEEFNEQRKAAFIRVKDYKQAGNRLVGFMCSYTPLEIIDAAGAASVALCGTSIVFSRALNAPAESICTSSMIYTLYLHLSGV